MQTVDLASKEESQALYERGDVWVAPAASVIGQAVVAFEIARAFLGKFGGDTYAETEQRFAAYKKQLEQYARCSPRRPPPGPPSGPSAGASSGGRAGTFRGSWARS